ncbi:MAG: hypothetical protein LLF97_01165 [Planctomycetaceae bacterium]|nr:hypothetical protein [Planctomycetaceae bacterium]
MSILRQLHLLYLCFFSKPASDRALLRAIRRNGVQKIVELDVADGTRARRMIDVARQASGEDVHYVGIDLFEGRSADDPPGLSLKAAYRSLRTDGVRVQLVPGDPSDGLARSANSLGHVDLLIVPARFDAPSFRRMWFFVPRMLHDRTLVLIDETLPDGRRRLRKKSASEIEQLVAGQAARRAA